MSLSITHRGQKLTQTQLDALIPVLNKYMQGEITKGNFNTEADKALEEAGCAIKQSGEIK